MTRFGHNLGYIHDLYRRYLADPTSVSEAWREFFADYRDEPSTSAPGAPVPTAPQAAAAEPAAPQAAPLRGAAARIVENMTASLEVPTATSVRTVPVKLLEENRRIINQHMALISGPKISFTHLIAWGIVRGLMRRPRMNVRYRMIDGKPHLESHEQIHLGLAIDLERKGERTLLVPNVKNATRLSFPAFVDAYDDLIVRARQGKLNVDDFSDTTITLTNPGTIGTVMSVPRLMQGQGAIIGIGAIGYPTEYAGVAAQTITELGLSKVMAVTSTYDHRVIQGAESGQFLVTLEQLLGGQHGFYVDLFQALGVPREPVKWAGDQNPQLAAAGGNTEGIAKQAGVLQLIRAYRVRGHLWADLDPLGYSPAPQGDLELSTYGLTVWDLDRHFITGGLGGSGGTLPLRKILDVLQRTYCRHVGVEFMHIPDPPTRHWLVERIEHLEQVAPLPQDEQLRILRMLNSAEAFETFLHTSYIGQKRFSLEGAETVLPMLETLLREATEAEMQEIVIGMAHRGRLNVLAHILGKSYGRIFGEFEGLDPDSSHGSGDVKYHLGSSGSYKLRDGRSILVSLSSNPSHLEAVNPVVEGMVRAKQDSLGDAGHERVLPVLIHGDAAFSGQGVVAETLNLSLLRGYRTGGTIHIVVNNQIGFTTRPDDLRSSQYSTDVAKMLRSPIFHVNADHPEDAVRVISLALAFRRQFKSDVVVDLVCYRRWGHNEGDDPSYTHPELYSQIQGHRSVRKLYTEQLVRRGDLDLDTAEAALEDFRRRLREVHEQVRQAQAEPPPAPRADSEAVDGSAGNEASCPDADQEKLERVLDGIASYPSAFEGHPKLSRQLALRSKRFAEDKIDWALAETLAFGSLVLEQVPVRLSGEDSGRGTFSQRHAIVYDYRSSEPYVPLAHVSPEQATFQVFDSLLSEFAVLGFDYGYSVARPEALVLWEAQFGDFVNGAQVIIDQFLVSAEEKWNQRCSLVLLLPHGHEGQGPEHSSARLERFLQLAARGNLRIAHPSTPASYFHLLRRQAHSETRKPLVVMTPKSLLRLPRCVSSRADMTQACFEGVLDDPTTPAPDRVRRIIACAGKVFYDLQELREQAGIDDVLILRFEQLYPFPGERFAELTERFAHVEDVVWVQEEPSNNGAWGFIRERLPERLGPSQKLRYVGRPRSASPATGSARRHAAEQQDLVRRALTSDATARG